MKRERHTDSLGVESEALDANLVEDLKPLARVRHHEVAVKEALGVLAERRHSGDAKGDVRDKVTVHDIDVQDVGSWREREVQGKR